VSPDYLTFLAILRCPLCKGGLACVGDDALRCVDSGCGRQFPIADGKPVLIAAERSVFTPGDYCGTSSAPVATARGRFAKLEEAARRLPSPSVNLSATRCLNKMMELLLNRVERPCVLVVGGGIRGKGMERLTSASSIQLINTDPSPTSDAALFCDAHDLPFADGAIDAVVCQAVLEHVADPWRCVEEIYRVLKPSGVVYSEIPFMQQVHQQGYDFTRFSHLGHRRLFRRFMEVESGAVAGPGTALAWSWRYFLAAFARGRTLTKILFWFGRITGTLFEQTDHFFRQRPGALDAASCTFFLGTRAEVEVSDRDLVSAYRGAQRR
jgi:SAM-dependent methyltransferase